MSAKPCIAIVHYHLRPGGVTRVIAHAARVLSANGYAVAIFAGDVPESFPAMENVLIRQSPALDYSRDFSVANGEALEKELKDAVIEAFGALPDAWHFHNHNLGKNLLLPYVVENLARQQSAMVLQIHDFAENGRPENYRRILEAGMAERCYPSTARIRYALLNSRDLRILKSAGAEEIAFLLPNPVAVDTSGLPDFSPTQLDAESLVLYPCRPIRRKNIGEALLWSHYFPRGKELVFPTAPENESEKRSYQRWVALSAALGLPVEFEVCSRMNVSLESLTAASEKILTTSITEGFGMAYLEPWLQDKPLVGRSLPGITEDFVESGMNLDHLYASLPIPVSWIGKQALTSRFSNAVQALEKDYRTEIPAEWIRETQSALFDTEEIDFGCLSEGMQAEVLRKFVKNKEAIIPDFLSVTPDVEMNSRVVREHYSKESYFRKIDMLYKDVMGSPSADLHTLDAQRLLRSHLRHSLRQALRAMS